MLTQNVRKIYLDRLNILYQNLRNCNSGAEVHEVGNMRNVIHLLRDLLDTADWQEDTFKCMIERLELKEVQFFKKKFDHLKK
jgi:hypothetical protein